MAIINTSVFISSNLTKLKVSIIHSNNTTGSQIRLLIADTTDKEAFRDLTCAIIQNPEISLINPVIPSDKEPLEYGEYSTTPKRYRAAKLSPAERLLLRQTLRRGKK